jgi:hypothetical protein
VSEPERSIACHGPLPVQDLRDAIGRDIEIPGKLRGTDADGLEFFCKMLAGMNRFYSHINS